MIVDSLFVEEDRLICVVATSKLTDEDRDSLVHLYGEDNIEYVSVRYLSLIHISEPTRP